MENIVLKDQRLLLAVSFGTSFADTREKTIGAIERRMAEKFPDRTVQRCFTSRFIRRKLLERDGLQIDSPEEAIQKARERGIEDLVVQPLYLMHGSEHRRLMETVREAAPFFHRLSVGKPLLSEDRDFRILAEAVCRQLPAPRPDTAVVLMGHGNGKKKKEGPKDLPEPAPVREIQDIAIFPVPQEAPREIYDNTVFPVPQEGLREIHDNAVFLILQEALREIGADNYYVATVEGEPGPAEVLPQMRAKGFRRVILAPFMVVAGDHARNDLAGEGDGSWKTLFMRNGFEVEMVLRGIGEWEEVQDLFAAHAAQCMDGAH